MKKLKKLLSVGKKRLFRKEELLENVAKTFIQTEGVRRAWSASTNTNYKVLLKHYKSYAIRTTIEDVDKKWIDGFVTHLHDKEGLRNSTIYMLLQEQRAILRWAMAEGYKINAEAVHYCPRLKSVNIRSNVLALTTDELQKLHDTHFESKSLKISRDIFLFCCYTSLRFSDVKRLKWADITDGWINIVTQKTNDSLHIPLNTDASRIVMDYRRHNYTEKRGCVFQTMSCVNYNVNIKKVARIAGLNRMVNKTWFKGAERMETSKPLHEVISSHVGRKTFVTLALSSGMPADVLCSITGHKDSRLLKHYYDISREEQRKWVLHLCDK